MSQLKITNAITNNRLKATEMATGESVVATLAGFQQGRYGNDVLLSIDGAEVILYPAGNLKFLQERVEKNEIAIGDTIVITRGADVRTKNGFTSSRFEVGQAPAANQQVASAPAAAKTTKEKLAEIQAKRN